MKKLILFSLITILFTYCAIPIQLEESEVNFDNEVFWTYEIHDEISNTHDTLQLHPNRLQDFKTVIYGDGTVGIHSKPAAMSEPVSGCIYFPDNTYCVQYIGTFRRIDRYDLRLCE